MDFLQIHLIWNSLPTENMMATAHPSTSKSKRLNNGNQMREANIVC